MKHGFVPLYFPKGETGGGYKTGSLAGDEIENKLSVVSRFFEIKNRNPYFKDKSLASLVSGSKLISGRAAKYL